MKKNQERRLHRKNAKIAKEGGQLMTLSRPMKPDTTVSNTSRVSDQLALSPCFGLRAGFFQLNGRTILATAVQYNELHCNASCHASSLKAAVHMPIAFYFGPSFTFYGSRVRRLTQNISASLWPLRSNGSYE